MSRAYLEDAKRRNKVYDLRDKLRPLRKKIRETPIPKGTEDRTNWDFMMAEQADLLAKLARLGDPLVGLYD